MDFNFNFCFRILQSCRSASSIQQVKQLHLLLLKKGVLHSAPFICNSVLQTYTRCGSLKDARNLFEEMPERSPFSWNTLIEGYLRLGKRAESLELFNLMPQKNEYSWNSVVSSFARSGDFRVARMLFDSMPVKSGIALNSVIHGHARNGDPEEALRLFKDFNRRPLDEANVIDTFVLATMLGVCAEMIALNCGKQIHAQLLVNKVDIDSVTLSSLINMYAKCEQLDTANQILNSCEKPDNFSLSALISGYAKCGRLTDARRIFDRSKHCVVSWNSMIAGYVTNNQAGQALMLYNMMQIDDIQPDSSTFTSVLSGCSNSGILENGKQVHTQAYKLGFVDDMIVASVLVDMYSKCGNPEDACKVFNELEKHDTVLLNSMINLYSNYRRVEDARRVFETMRLKSIISWNSMIVCYSQNGHAIEALDLFCRMNNLDIKMDKVTLASVLSACAGICALRLGNQIFARAIILGLDSDQIFCTSLIDLYCRCGDITEGHRIFDEMTKLDAVPWNSLLMGYSTNGYGTEALKLFEEMRNTGVSPNGITFTAVLSACSHSGLIMEGKRWFYSMESEYNIVPEIEHYSCMIDLCARAGFLEEAMDLIENMPFEADASMWSSILRGCIAHEKKALANEVAERVIELDPGNSCAYVQLASMHATSGDWERSAQVRRKMQGRKILKNPGCSWIEIEQEGLVCT